MPENRLREIIEQQRTSAEGVAFRVSGMDLRMMSYIEYGTLMPTRKLMEGICKTLDCRATDIYDAVELDLNVPGREIRYAQAEKAQTGRQEPDQGGDRPGDRDKRTYHEGQVQLRVWMDPEEKAALEKACQALGYHSVTEWAREMYRYTVLTYAQILQKKPIQSYVPPLRNRESGTMDKA